MDIDKSQPEAHNPKALVSLSFEWPIGFNIFCDIIISFIA